MAMQSSGNQSRIDFHRNIALDKCMKKFQNGKITTIFCIAYVMHFCPKTFIRQSNDKVEVSFSK